MINVFVHESVKELSTSSFANSIMIASFLGTVEGHDKAACSD